MIFVFLALYTAEYWVYVFGCFIFSICITFHSSLLIVKEVLLFLTLKSYFLCYFVNVIASAVTHYSPIFYNLENVHLHIAPQLCHLPENEMIGEENLKNTSYTFSHCRGFTSQAFGSPTVSGRTLERFMQEAA